MSTTIDERVVEMRFDNKQFESNVQTSLSTLDKLKQSLNLDGAAKGLESIGSAAKNCDMSGLSGAVQTVQARFSSLEVIAVTALANITNSVVNAGKQMLESLTIEPISQGFSEYELKMGSIQTIMASTGASLEEVNGYLNELNTYADKTIYSFSDMTTNIGKFTNAGVKLEDAVMAIQGISNEAAVSGANANEASRAMYNFAQALSAGYVKLIDWKSIENANMATVEFKTQLLESAVAAGTLEKTADGMYKVLSTNASGSTMDATIDATHNFNESLEYQWMTTDALVSTLKNYADETTEIGKKAFAAAQDVKTFTQLTDTLKEAAGSGWATTWEILFGDFEEAKSLWTECSDVLGGFIDTTSKARNELLQGWKDLGGRTELIEAVKNAFEGLVSVVKPIGEAFREIFPKTTSEQLYNMTAGLKEFTSHLKLSDKASENLKSTFKGLFAVLDIVKQAFSAVFSAIKPLFGLLPGLGDGVLGVTGSIGDWIVALDESLKKNQTFKKALEGIVGFIQGIPAKINSVFQSITRVSIGDAFDYIREKIEGALEKIKEIFNQFKNVDTSGVDSLASNLEKRFEPLRTLFDGVKKVFNGMWEFFKKISPLFAGLATVLGNALGSVGDALMSAIEDADFDGILDLINGGTVAAIGIALKSFIDSLSDVTSGDSGMLGSIKGILDGVRGCFEAYQSNLKANTLIKIAGAIAVLTAAVVVLSMIDSEKLSSALGAMSAEFVELFASMAVFEKIVGSEGFKGMGKVATTMVGMAAAVLILSVAMKNLADLDWDGILKGLVGVAGLTTTLTLAAKSLSQNSGKLISGAAGLVVFALAIKMLVEPTKELGALDTATLAKGLIGIGVLVTELALFLKGADLDNVSLGKGLGLMALAEAINILADAVAKFAGMNTSGMIQGLVGVGVVLTELAAFTKLTGDSSKIISTSTGMVILGAAMLVFGEAVEKFGSMSIEELAKGLTAMAASLTIVAVALKFMPTNTAVIATGMVLVGAALKIMASAMSDFAGLSWEELAKGLVAMAGGLTVMAVATNAMTGALAGAAAILVVAAAIDMLTPALKALGNMSLAEIGKSLLVLAGAFTVIGVAGAVLSPIIPAILGLSAAVTLLGVGALACGTGVLALAAGLSALSVGGAAAIAALVLAIEAIISLIPQILTKVGEGIVALITAIGNAAPELATAVVQVVSAIITALTGTIPQVVEGIVLLIETTLTTLAEHLPTIVQAGIDIVIAFLEGIRNNIGEVVTIVIDIIVQTLEAIAAKIPDIIQAGIDIVIGLIDGLAQGITDNAPRIRDAFINLFNSLLEAVLVFLGIHSPSTVFADIGVNVIQGLINGIGSMLSSAVTAIVDVVTSVVTAIKDKLGEFLTKGKELMTNLKNGISNKLSEVKSTVTNVITNCVSAIANKASQFLTKGKELMTNLKNGISNKLSEVKNMATNVVSKALNGISDKVSSFTSIGSNLMNGLKNGISSAASSIVNAAKGVVNNAISAAKNLLGIHSPSKVFAEIGEYTDEGFVVGLNAYASKVENASEDVGKSAVSGISGAISGISDMVNSDMNTEPTIRPVLDLTDITTGANKINDMLSGQHSLDLAARTSYGVNSALETNQNGVSVDNSDVVEALSTLRGDVSSLASVISNLKVVMDTGTLVGTLTAPLDASLGRQAAYAGRGI